jgi:hypothetical protein
LFRTLSWKLAYTPALNRADIVQEVAIDTGSLGCLDIFRSGKTGLNHLDSKVGTFQLKNVAIYPNMGRIKCLKRYAIPHLLLTMDYSRRLLDSRNILNQKKGDVGSQIV